MVQGGARHMYSHQHKGDRALQGYSKTKEFDVKSLGVMIGKRLMFFLEDGFLRKANQNRRK